MIIRYFMEERKLRGKESVILRVITKNKEDPLDIECGINYTLGKFN